MLYPIGDRPVANQDGLGRRVALARNLERHRGRADAAVHLGQRHVHGEVARTQAACGRRARWSRWCRRARPGVQARRRLPSGSSPAPLSIDPTAKAVALRITAGPGRRWSRRSACAPAGSLRLATNRPVAAKAGGVELVQQRVDRREVTALDQGTIEHQQGRWPTRFSASWPVEPRPRQRHWLGPGQRRGR